MQARRIARMRSLMLAILLMMLLFGVVFGTSCFADKNDGFMKPSIDRY